MMKMCPTRSGKDFGRSSSSRCLYHGPAGALLLMGGWLGKPIQIRGPTVEKMQSTQSDASVSIPMMKPED